jgi:predicted DNA-binding helix-hairpin-helix protein
VQRILDARRHGTLRLEDLARIGCVLGRARPFITLPGWIPRADAAPAAAAPRPQQLSLF